MAEIGTYPLEGKRDQSVYDAIGVNPAIREMATSYFKLNEFFVSIEIIENSKTGVYKNAVLAELGKMLANVCELKSKVIKYKEELT